MFALAYNEGVSPVGVSLRKDVPRAGTREGDIILGIESSRRKRGGVTPDPFRKMRIDDRRDGQ